MRVKAVISYRGDRFHGFQRQKSTKHTVSTAIEEALVSLNINSLIVGSGRTDSGVHASGQVIHFDIPIFWSDLHRLTEMLNRKLKYIFIKHISHVDDNFHARFSAKRRIYRYVFKSSPISIFEVDTIANIQVDKIEDLSLALSAFVGKHDFSLFIKTGSLTHNNIREIYSTKCITRHGYQYIYIEGNGFLRSQIRMLIGAAMEVANDNLTLAHLKEQLALKKVYTRKIAPPEGLYLARILY